MFFPGGQVSISEFSARPNPSLESVAVRARRLAPAACDVSVKLNCPSEIAYETAVAVLKVNESIEARSPLSFKPEDFKI